MEKIMKKAGLLNLLNQLKLRDGEERTDEIEHLTAMEVIDILLEYVNDKQVTEIINELPL